jgi:N-acetylneuraminic acid mutarotase
MIRPLFSFIIFCFLHLSLFSNPWVKKANFGGVGRHRAVGISIANKGYMGLGHVNGTGIDISYKDWWQYDPASDTWTQKANFPVNNHGATSFATSTRGYVGGGSSLSNEFYEYNPITNSWSPIAPCLINPGDTQGFSVNEKGYVYLTNQLAEYNPITNSWVMKTPAPVNFGNWSCSFATNSSGFIKSGGNFYEYKPENDTWIQRASFPGLMSNGSSAFCRDGKGYFTCGYVGSLSNVTNEVWEFNPGSNSWTFICEFPGTSRRFPVAFSINGKGYFGTGTNGVNLNDFWQFDFDPLNIPKNNLFVINTYPNPVVNQLTINIESASFQSGLTFNIYSQTGQKVDQLELSNNIQTIENLGHLKGIHLFTIEKARQILKTGKILFE